MGKALTGAVVPAKNEYLTIFRVVEDTRLHVDHVVVVDDGSDDRTGLEAGRAGAIVLRNDRSLGQGGAVRRGLSHLFQLGCYKVVTLDGDGAHDPKWIPHLLASQTASGADLTIGSRFIDESTQRSIPSPKIAANRFATGLINRLLGTKHTDVASGMRLVTAAVAELPLQAFDFSFAFELLRLASLAALSVDECSISVRYDATELHCTNRAELVHLVRFCRSICGASDLRSSLNNLAAAVNAFKPFTAVVNQELFVVHPVREHGGYFFQIQSDWYRSLHSQLETSACLTF